MIRWLRALRTPRPRPRRWDSTEAQVLALPAAIRATSEQARVHVEPSPLRHRYTTHAADGIAVTARSYRPRHAAIRPREPRQEARLTTTEAFDAIVADEGEPPPRRHGPREDDIRGRRIVWTEHGWVHDDQLETL